MGLPFTLLRSRDAVLSCDEAHDACRPTYVFSVSGQVLFRQALYHLTACRATACLRLRRGVMAAMQKKLRWLLHEEALLGCVHIQPYLYGASHIVLGQENFELVAAHFAHCPRNSCAQLRRSLLLTIRHRLA